VASLAASMVARTRFFFSSSCQFFMYWRCCCCFTAVGQGHSAGPWE
jgi:hypothetical protein